MRETFLNRSDRPALPHRALAAWAGIAALAAIVGLARSSGWVGSDSPAGSGAHQVATDGGDIGRGPDAEVCPRILGLPNTACLSHANEGVAGGDQPAGDAGRRPSTSPGAGGAAGAAGAAGEGAAAQPAAGPAVPSGASPGSTAGPPTPGGGPATTAGPPATGSATTKPGASASSPATTAPAPQVAPLPPDVIEQVCSILRAAGAAPARRGTDLYAPELDPDNNGLACE